MTGPEDDAWKEGLTPWQLLESAIRDKSEPEEPGDLALAEEALAKGADVNEEHEDWTALMYAAIENDAAMVDWLFAHGAEPDGAAVMEAARFDSPAACEALIRHGCPVDWDEHGDSPVLLAAREGFFDVVRVLVAAGADVDHRDDSDTSTRMLLESAGRLDLLD
ncbi:MAG: ankyrin repeat domain-containing protein [Deltaproteobacteria bacterium]|nr:ankyrin repeat domain-containing protein [Deltaproteobacteria bacterium]